MAAHNKRNQQQNSQLHACCTSTKVAIITAKTTVLDELQDIPVSAEATLLDEPRDVPVLNVHVHVMYNVRVRPHTCTRKFTPTRGRAALSGRKRECEYSNID